MTSITRVRKNEKGQAPPIYNKVSDSEMANIKMLVPSGGVVIKEEVLVFDDNSDKLSLKLRFLVIYNDCGLLSATNKAATSSRLRKRVW